MSKYTPGPWEVRCPIRAMGWWVVVDSKGMALGDGEGGYEKPDAQLIAAAPSLYSTLKKLDRLNRGLDAWHQDAWADAWVAARAALAKVEE